MRKQMPEIHPLVSKELLPKVEGILIVASGGDNQKVKQNISEAVLAIISGRST